MRHLEAQDDPRGTLTVALRLLTADPLSDLACQAALRAYHRLGEREPGLRLYQRFAAALKQTLDAEPQPETTALYRRLRGQKPAAIPSPAAPPPPLPSPREVIPKDITRPALAGRHRELERLRHLWRQTVQKGSYSLWLAGPPGIGKTRLADAFAEDTRRRGGQVLIGHCSAFAGDAPYTLLQEVLQHILALAGRSVLDHLSPWQAALLSRLEPTLSAPEASLPAPRTAEAEQRHLFHALTRLVLSLARRTPLLLIVEDVHRAQSTIVLWLQTLLQESQHVPLLLLLTYRPGEFPLDAPIGQLRHKAQKGGRGEVLTLHPLTLADLQAWMPALPEDLLTALHRHTEGNPFFVLETVRVLLENGQLQREGDAWQWRAAEKPLPIPDTVRQAIRLRYRRLSSLPRQALEVAAVIGRAFDLDLWQTAWEHGQEALLEALNLLLRRGWLREGQGPFARDFEFTHHLSHEAVYQEIPLPRRRRLHRQVAEALRALAPGRDAEIAFHLVRGEDWAQAWPHLLKAGDRALHVAATEEALACYEEALRARQHLPAAADAPLPEAILQRKIGEVYFQQGEYTQAERHLHRALQHLRHPFPRHPWQLHRRLLAALGAQLRHHLPLPRRRAAAADLPAAAEEVAVYIPLGWMYSLQGRYEEYLLVSLRAFNVAEAAGYAAGEAVAAAGLGIAGDVLAWFGLAEYFHRRAARLLPQLSQANDIGFVRFTGAYHAYLTGEEALALTFAAQSAQAYRQAQDPHSWGTAVLLQAYIHLYHGRFEQAEQLAGELQQAGRDIADPSIQAAGHTVTGILACLDSRWKEAAAHFQAAAALAAQVPDHLLQAENLGRLARCRARQGAWESAEEALAQGETIIKEQDVWGDALTWFRISAAAVRLLQAHDALQRRQKVDWRGVRRAVWAARRQVRGFRPALPEALRLQGDYAWLRGNPRQAQRLWEQSLDAAQRLEHSLDRGLAAWRIGHHLHEPALLEEGRRLLEEHLPHWSPPPWVAD